MSQKTKHFLLFVRRIGHFKVKQPFSSDGLRGLLVSFKDLFISNFPAACLSLGGTIMTMGCQRIIQSGGSCPVVLLTGDTETSKTSLKSMHLSNWDWRG